jgi:hypothetical protein
LYAQPHIRPAESARMPITLELDAIRTLMPRGDYCILIDDLRFWADLPWSDGQIPAELMPSVRSLDFLYPFCDGHSVTILLNGSGYALISPFGAPTLQFVA